jgi:hypothetical protein
MANKYIIKIPPKATPLEADNWRAVDAIQNATFSTTDKVNATTTGLSAIAGKIKIDDGDSTANYLQTKLIAGAGITLTESLTGGKGSKILTAAIGAHADLTDMPDTVGDNTDHDIRYVTKVQTGTPTTPTPYEGMRWYDTNAIANPSVSFVVVTTTYSVADEIEFVFCDSSTAFTVTLPTATGSGRPITIKNVNTGAITVSKAGDTIDSETSQVVSWGDSMSVVDYAANKWGITP